MALAIPSSGLLQNGSLDLPADHTLLGKCIVVIGGTSGIGLSASSAFHRQGAHVLVLGKDEEGVNNLNNLKTAGLWAMYGDACRENTAQDAIDQCVMRFGNFHALYHVAGGSGRALGDGPIHEMSFEGWQKTMEWNLTSVMFSNRAAIRYFLQNRQGGCLLNLGSVLGHSPSPAYFGTFAYSTAKSAIEGMTRTLAAYYAPNNIRINAITPGLIQTPMSHRAVQDPKIVGYVQSKQPLDGGRIGRPSDIDGAAVFLLSDDARFVTGQVIGIDGGWSVTEGQIH